MLCFIRLFTEGTSCLLFWKTENRNRRWDMLMSVCFTVLRMSQVSCRRVPLRYQLHLCTTPSAKWPALRHSLDLLVPGASSPTDSSGRWMWITQAVCESAGGGEAKAGVIHSSLQPLLSCWGIINQARSRPWGLVTIATHYKISFPPCCPPFPLKYCGKLSRGSAFVYLPPPNKLFRVAL